MLSRRMCTHTYVCTCPQHNMPPEAFVRVYFTNYTFNCAIASYDPFQSSISCFIVDTLSSC